LAGLVGLSAISALMNVKYFPREAGKTGGMPKPAVKVLYTDGVAI